MVLEDFYRKAPREIREIMYGSMLGDQTINVREQNLLPSTTRPEVRNIGNLVNATAGIFEPFWDALASAGYKGLLNSDFDSNITHEMVETFYFHSRYRFVDLTYVPRYLNFRINYIDLGMHQLVKTVEVYHFFNSGACIRPVSSDLAMDPISLADSLDRYARNMQYLHSLKPKSSILLTLQFAEHLLQPSVADKNAAVHIDYLTVLFPELEKLVKAGYKVSVKLGYLLKFRVWKEELTAECWTRKIECHQMVSHSSIARNTY